MASTGMDGSRLMFAQTHDYFEKDGMDVGEDNVNQYSIAKKCYTRFIREFCANNEFIYRDTLRDNYAPLDDRKERRFHLNINLYDLKEYLKIQQQALNAARNELDAARGQLDEGMQQSLGDKVDNHEVFEYGSKVAEWLEEKPSMFIPAFEEAAKEVVDELTHPRSNDEPVQDIQVMLSSRNEPQSIRSLKSTQVSQLVRVKGIIIAASQVRCKATQITLQCRTCRHTRTEVSIRPGFDGYQLPRMCSGGQGGHGGQKCPLDPYFVLPDKCKCVDFQVLKLQETPEDVPHGELPRHMQLYCDRYLTDRVTPGNRVTLVGVYAIKTMKTQNKGADKNKSAIGIRLPYIRVVGIDVEQTIGGGRTDESGWTHEEEQLREKLMNDPKAYEAIVKSIAPSIYGSEDIKKAIACLLFSGSRKRMPDGLTRRGDINVLLLGDPGTAKSQLLKFVQKVAPIAVYTSGKGSSAAGLTASVVKDPASRGFMMEGGAMVLADGGVVCIDEFDKMREDDRVAIHEAMEQQTISIAKAGITTTLNSRCAVLAAANSVYGRWDDTKGDDNIEFMPTILSRFDTIFIVKDEHDEQRDKILARHVMNIHMTATANEEEQEGVLSLEFLRKYIAYARENCGPRLKEKAAEKLVNYYVKLRNPKTKDLTAQKSSIPLTVRQLEAIVRMSEALAKMRLKKFADVQEVDEAIRLFQVSTLEAAATGHLAGAEGFTSDADQETMTRIERQIKKRFAIGTQVSEHMVVQDFVRQNYPEHAVQKVLQALIRRGEIQHRFQRKMLFRVK